MRISLLRPLLRTMIRVGATVLLLGSGLAPGALEAQGVDIIRGRVTGGESQPLSGIQVTATTLSGNVSRSARTDAAGRYTISFPGGEGDYWVTVTAIGFSPRRFQVKRTADQDILIADARLSPAAISLETVRVSERAALNRADTVSDVSGNEKTLDPDPRSLAHRPARRPQRPGCRHPRRPIPRGSRWRRRRVLGFRARG